MERQIHRKALADRRKPFRSIANEIEPQISDKSVARALDKRGMHRRIARKVPFLTQQQKKARLEWACAREGEDWDTVMWSDECYIQMDDKMGQVYVTRTVNEEYNEACLIPTFKQSALRVMVWGCVTNGWKGPLIILEYPGGKGGGMTAGRYCEQVLEGVLMKAMEGAKKKWPGMRFQQDGAPSHTAKVTHQWFSSHEIALFPHPANSPDLSPIEPVWKELKRRVRAHQPRPTTLETLKIAIQEEWERMPLEDITKHTKKMRERVEAVLKVKGGHTKF
ncbi:unnamed protein product [Mycena citricolor]|uniref:Transposase n=1 Tax=Mycena citricolor TaxID=2018698 RepID=A0AAD2H5F1_9AGAR|nr:unnamed protein product [Mycena citricolor]